ncbi:hypothetical protein MmiAt1_10520 [Methanimicrococcus sp. At1]|uniref:Uncharacterized protein n=1 Tax=Methanimicrococcus hacksteinii TaxID=3028293 RepID=A0ABU3VPY6_9EURY|nr:hypothetical protein [Methanimicrococcus sp. At1]
MLIFLFFCSGMLFVLFVLFVLLFCLFYFVLFFKMKHRFFKSSSNPNSVFCLSHLQLIVFQVLSGVRVCRKFKKPMFEFEPNTANPTPNYEFWTARSDEQNRNLERFFKKEKFKEKLIIFLNSSSSTPFMRFR